MGRLTRVSLAAAVIVAGAIAGSVAGRSQDTAGTTSADHFLTQYTELLRLVLDNSPRPLKADEAVYTSLDGMLSVLDPHTNFFTPDAFNSMRERQEGSFHGIGVIISIRGGRVTVITPIEGTPAARLGLRAGDIIETIDGEPTEGLDLDDVAKRLRGPEGTTVKVTISRPGLAEPLEMSIQRARVPSDSVRYAFLIGKDTAYIRVSDFTRTTGDEFTSALERLRKEGATRLLLDLRDNPGGIVDSAVQVASAVLQPGQQVFSTRGRTADSFQDYRAARNGPHFTGPVIVLANRGSASASEIVSGAIQDHDRGLIVGERTFGKGVVQTVYPVQDAGLALTTAKYYTPSGRCIQRDYDSFFTYLHPVETGGEEAEATPTPAPGPVYFTDSGRKVYGGGGIVPDEVVAQGEYSERVARLLGNSAFFHFAVSYLADKPDKAAAAKDFTAGDDALARFKAMVVEKKWLPEKEIDAALADATDRRDIQVGLRSEVMSAAVSLTAGYEASTAVDTQLQAALKMFDEAARLYARVHNGAEQQSADAGH